MLFMRGVNPMKGNFTVIPFNKQAKNLLITFGGTDHKNYTLQTLETIVPLCEEHRITIRVVTGPGYIYKEALNEYFKEIEYKGIKFEYNTNIISSIMEKSDIAISSAGRTVYELAYMRIPAVVFSHHEREDQHTFARPQNGFEYIGIMDEFDPIILQQGLKKLMDTEYREILYRRMSKFRFEYNKSNVVGLILKTLET